MVYRLIILCLLLVFVLPLMPSQSAIVHPIRIASEGARPPYNFLDEKGQLAGFDIDLGRALCDKLARPCEFITQDWDGLIPELLANHYDAVMAALGINDERRADIAFSNPYVQTPLVGLVRKDDARFQSLDNLNTEGVTLGIDQASNGQAYLESHLAKTEAKAFGSFEDAMLDLSQNRIDGVLGDADTVADFLANRGEAVCCRVLAVLPYDAEVQGEGIAIGLRKEDEGLRADLNAALVALKQDGTFAMIAKRYFRFPVE